MLSNSIIIINKGIEPINNMLKVLLPASINVYNTWFLMRKVSKFFSLSLSVSNHLSM